jgi:hypothetical protein
MEEQIYVKRKNSFFILPRLSALELWATELNGSVERRLQMVQDVK